MPRPPARIPDLWPSPLPPRDDGRSAPQAIVDLVLDALDRATLHPGDRLPSSRALAVHLEVPRGVVTVAYDTLAAMGVARTVPGSGTTIADGSDGLAHALLSTVPTVLPPPPPARPVISLEPGLPDVALIDERRWRRSWRHATRLTAPADLDARIAELRLVLAAQLRRSRAVVCAPSDIRLFPGVNPALRSIADWFGAPIAMEDPGYRRAFDAFRATGNQVVSVPVDEEGLVVDRLPDRRCLVYVTPAHQYPTGVRMSMSRRLALLRWARATGGLVVEDDYDGEFSYDVAPLPALHRLDPESVVYIGTASKALSPLLRIAWTVLPERCRELPNAGNGSGAGVDGTAATMLAHFISSGGWDNHIARASRTYGARRAAVQRALALHVPDAHVIGVEAGLHLTLDLGSPDALATVLDNLEVHGYRASTVAAHALQGSDLGGTRPEDSGPREDAGLLVSYALIPETRADTVIRLLAPR
ncbi:PLP-dependent aminotransferase family protein [Tsukamurella pseudospumae]|uniref:HTH gntR-type domain-containing protein n=1 Tax=Tsukamurella pseudospumae TaxID=239498 RepID=A0A138AUX8_9ACTN|nr:PLP-dependent aminotransferase family protein [Tsukamurella pseudospumae]KXP14277.1 hypothetical protein AXK60_20885 [Tsukamurella pseudospumae]